MSGWNLRQMPHPLLAPWSDDYKENVSFQANVPEAVLTNNGHIDLHIQYRVTSNFITDLIGKGKAKYTCLLTCPNTLTRETHTTSYPDQHLTLPAGNFAQNLFLTPHICATESIDKFTSPEHSDEYLMVRPDGFSIASASILAIGHATVISLQESTSPYSVIDLVADEGITPGTFDLDLEQDRLKIHVSPVDKSIIDSRRQLGGYSREFISLASGLYLHAIAEAIRQLDEHKCTEWHDTICWALERHSIQSNSVDLKRHAIRYAQTLMGNPIGRLLTTFSRSDEEDL